MARKTKKTVAALAAGLPITAALAAIYTSNPFEMMATELLDGTAPVVAETLSPDEVAAIEASEEVSGSEAPLQEVQSFDELRATITDAELDAAAHAIAKAMDQRADYEMAKNPDNTNIQKTIAGARAKLVTKRAASVLLACNVDEGFINRTTNEGSRYNVYALGKLADLVAGASDGAITNAINLACMKSLFAMRRAGFAFTGEIAKACASDKIRRLDPAVRSVLIRHTVSEGVASTQSSSTMQALETLGIVSVSGSRRAPVYTLTEAPVTRHIETKLAA